MLDKCPLVTIVIPAYNEQQYIAFCIESVLAQTYINLEIILHDDSSTDNTLKIMNSFSDSRLKVLSSSVNLGHEKVWNELLGAARGKYIKVLCADDSLTPGSIKKSVEVLEASSAIMVFGSRFIIDKLNREVFKKSSFKSDNFSLDPYTIIRKGFLRGSNLIGEPNCVLFRSSALTKGLRFNFENYWMVDPDFYIQLGQLGNFAYVDEVLSTFRVTSSSWSVRNSFKQASMFKKYFIDKNIAQRFSISSPLVILVVARAYLLQVLRQVTYIVIVKLYPRL